MEPSNPFSEKIPVHDGKRRLGLVLGFVIVLGLGMAGGYWLTKFSSPSSVPQATPPVSTTSPVNHPAVPTGPVDQDLVVPQAAWDRMMSVDMGELLRDAKISRYREGGETKGIRLTHIKPGSVYDLVGFKDNDIVERLNGIAVADMEAGGTSALRLPEAKFMEIRVKRDGREATLRVRVGAEAPRTLPR